MSEEIVSVIQAQMWGADELLYDWSPPDETIKVGSGMTMPVREWLRKERERIAGDRTRTAFIVQKSDGKLSLYVDRRGKK